MRNTSVKKRSAVLMIIALIVTSLNLQPVWAIEAGTNFDNHPVTNPTTVSTDVVQDTDETDNVDDPANPDETNPDDAITDDTNTDDTNTDDTTIDKNTTGTSKSVSADRIEAVTESTVSANQTLSANSIQDFVSGYHEIDFTPELPNWDGIMHVEENLPDSYNSMTAGHMSPVRNQGYYGTCWAHATMATAEASMIMRGQADTSSVDYAERQLAYFFYNYQNINDPIGNTLGDYTKALKKPFYDQGGNQYFTVWALSNWIGAADEEKAPYSGITSAGSDSLNSSLCFDDLAHMQNGYFLSFDDPTDIKQNIKDHGAVAMSYYAYNTTETSIYYPNNNSSNHAVTLIGWDDNYSRSNFASSAYGPPPSDGAWLIKNSWGTWNGDDGLMWISYEDKTICDPVVYDFAPADNYDHNYFYDGSCGANAYYFPSGTTFMNTFTAQGNEDLQAVSIGLSTTNTDYSVQIYKNPTSSTDPISGTPMLSTPVTGSTTYQGYYTVPLNESVHLAEGDKFVVAFTLTNDNNSDVSINVDLSYTNSDWIQFITTQKSGQSQYLVPGYSLGDIASQNSATFRIKAFTSDAVNWDFDDSNFVDDNRTIPMEYCYEDGQYTSTHTITLTGVYSATDLVWSSSDEDVAVVDENGVVTAMGAGSTTIEARKGNNKKCCTVEVTKAAEYLTTGTAPTLTFSGSAQEPLIDVFDGSTKLEKDKDYTLSYTNNIHTNIKGQSANPVQVPTITIRGSGKYTGSTDVEFQINPKGISALTLASSGEVTPASFAELSAGVELSDIVLTDTANQSLAGNDYHLTEGEDYTVVYSNNTQIGQATAVVYGKGDYEETSSKSKTFMIVNGWDIDESNFLSGTRTIAIEYEQTEGQDTGTHTITMSSGIAAADLGWTSSKPAVATVDSLGVITAKGVGTSTITGTAKGVVVTCTVKVVKSLSKLVIQPVADQKFTGKEIKPAVVVTDNGKKLAQGTDYTVSYSGNIEADETAVTPTITVTGVGKYSGTTSINFAIIPKSVSRLSMTISPTSMIPTSAAELAAGLEPKKVSLRDTSNALLTGNNYYLREGTDYELIYSNNTALGTATVTARGLGNYANDTERTATYKIIGTSITKARFNAIPTMQYRIDEDGAAACTPEVSVKTGINGYIPVEGTDYTVTYSNNNKVGTAKATITGTGLYYGTTTLSFRISTIPFNDKLADGAEGHLTVGDYNASASSVTEGISNQVYTANAIKPNMSVIYTTADGTKTALVPGTDYVTYYSNNKNAGTAKITIQGRGAFTGTIVRTFVIDKKDLSDGHGSVVVTAPDMKYTGREIKPTPTVTYICENGTRVVLRKGADYTVSYTNNVGISPGSSFGNVLINAKGYYTGTASTTFKIAGTMASSFNITITPGLDNPKRTSFVFDGKPRTFDYDNDGSNEGLTVKYKNTVLNEMVGSGNNYSVSYINNDKAGYGQAVIRGEGDNAGTKILYFRITPRQLLTKYNEGIITVNNIPAQTYTKYAVKPSVTVTDANNTIRPGGVLIEGVDYRLAYINNVRRSSNASVRIIGMGSYSGTIIKSFTIQ